MLTFLLSLLSGGTGGLLRLAPEVFKFFTDKSDKAHELAMTQLQLQIDAARATQQIDLAHVQGDMAAQAGMMQAYDDALKGQAAPTGVKWVDALSASVRPVVTYWWMALMTGYKIVIVTAAGIELYVSWKAVTDWNAMVALLIQFGNQVWTIQDAGILSMILGFWFVDRAIRHNTGR